MKPIAYRGNFQYNEKNPKSYHLGKKSESMKPELELLRELNEKEREKSKHKDSIINHYQDYVYNRTPFDPEVVEFHEDSVKEIDLEIDSLERQLEESKKSSITNEPIKSVSSDLFIKAKDFMREHGFVARMYTPDQVAQLMMFFATVRTLVNAVTYQSEKDINKTEEVKDSINKYVDTKQKLLLLMNDKFGTEVENESATDHFELKSDIGLDSLDQVELIMEVEDYWNISFRDEDVEDSDTLTIKQLVELIIAKLPKQ